MCLTCLLVPSGANRILGRASQFRPTVESSRNRPQHKTFAIVSSSSVFRHIQDNLEAIRVHSSLFVHGSDFSYDLVKICNILTRATSRVWMQWKHYHISVSLLSWSSPFYLLVSFSISPRHGHNCGRYQRLFPPLRRADHGLHIGLPVAPLLSLFPRLWASICSWPCSISHCDGAISRDFRTNSAAAESARISTTLLDLQEPRSSNDISVSLNRCSTWSRALNMPVTRFSMRLRSLTLPQPLHVSPP
jgi:hypothetical protein